MTAATTTDRPSSVTRIGDGLPVGLASIAAVASLPAAVSGNTVARSMLALALALAVGTWLRTITPGRPPATMLAVVVLLGLAGPLHVALTSPTAAWAYDSHMVPAELLPGVTVRLAVAWAVPLLWVTALLIMAAVAHRRGGHLVGALLLAGAGVAPLLVGTAFPTDAYQLLWDTTTLGHPSYVAGACAVLLVTAARCRATTQI